MERPKQLSITRSIKRLDISEAIPANIAPTFRERLRAVNICEILTRGGATIKEAIEIYKKDFLY